MRNPKSVLLRAQYLLPAQRDHLAAVDHDGGSDDETAGVGHEQQYRAVKVAVLAKPADRNFAPELIAGFARQIVAVEIGHEPAGRDSINANTLEGELEAERLGELHDPGFRGRIGRHPL